MSAPRKSRRRRLWVSETLGAPKKWSPTKEDWWRFEKAYGIPRGQHFDDQFRNEIHSAVTLYFYWEPFERAPFADDFVAKLLEARSLADTLAKVVCSFGNAGTIVAPHWQMYFPPEREEGEIHHQALGDDSDSTLLERILAMPTRRGRDHRDFEEVVHTIGSTLDSALVEVRSRESAGFCEGEEWGNLIRRLKRAFEDRTTKKVGISNDRQESPFVRFFRALQSTFDEEFRRHEADSGLSKAMSQAIGTKEKTTKTGVNLSRRKKDKLPQMARKRV